MRYYSILILFLVSFSFACGNGETASGAGQSGAEQTATVEAVPVVDQADVAKEPGTGVATEVVKEKEEGAPTVSEKIAQKQPDLPKEVEETPEEPVEAQPEEPVIEEPHQDPRPTPTVKEAEKEEVVEEKPVVAAAPSHAIWDELLRKYVNSAGRVNYAGLKKDMNRLNEYLDLLSKNPPQAGWSRAEEMAYWINAYNAFTVKLILDNYPVKSITDIHGGQPWKVRWIKLGSKTYSLDEIENGILRPKFKDARIHFAVNCAAKSCPPLLNQAWTAQNLESNFEKKAHAFVNNPAYNKISPANIQVSKIFEWYAQDFGDLITFLNRYSKVKIKPNAKVSYLEYDWALNSQ